MKYQFENSKKVYVEGSRKDIKVPFREIQLKDTLLDSVSRKNEPFRVYDTSGPYSDPDVVHSLESGLPSVREKWIIERNDTEYYSGRVEK